MIMRRNIIIMGFALLIIATGYGFYQYNRQSTDIRNESADIKIGAVDLVQAFNRDEENANRKYVDKVLLVTGKLKYVEYNSSGQATMLLDAGDPLVSVICSFYEEETPALKSIAPGANVEVKGVCNGKLMDIVLNKCSMVK